MATKTNDKSGYAYGSIICAVVAIFILGIPMSIAAIVFGVLGLSSDKPGERVLSGLGLVFGIIFALISVMALSL